MAIDLDVEAVISRLPVKSERQKEVPAYARMIASRLMMAADAPRFRPSTKGGKGEVEKLRNKAYDLLKCLNELSCDSYVPINEKMKRPTIAIGIDLERMIHAADQLLQNHTFSKPKAGAPKKAGVADMSDYILEIYEHLTGKPATISFNNVTSKSGGEFLEFMSDIFKVLGIADSPEAQARSARKRRGGKL